jgi:hypothetical protein
MQRKFTILRKIITTTPDMSGEYGQKFEYCFEVLEMVVRAS